MNQSERKRPGGRIYAQCPGMAQIFKPRESVDKLRGMKKGVRTERYMESLAIVLRQLADFVVYGISGLAAAYYYYTHQKKELPGGFWGAAFVAIIGAVLVTMLAGLEAWFIRLVSWLMQPKFGDVLLVRVNLITAVIGAFLFVYILNRINQNRTRR
jgi:uncharacterized membrane protein YeaQ/YmgE (transglycosylase-associated protein family)